MKTHVYSSIDAHSLLHELERIAKKMPDNYSTADVPYHGGSTKIGQLNLSETREGEIESATLTQLNDKILVATLNGDSHLDPLISKRRLAAFLGPLLKLYNTSDKENLAADDQVIMIFEDDMQRV